MYILSRPLKFDEISKILFEITYLEKFGDTVVAFSEYVSEFYY